MKRIYITPFVEVIGVECDRLISNSIPSVNDNDANPDSPVLIKRRGVWGDIWK